MESVIKWRTGEPKEREVYLVCDKCGNIDVDYWSMCGWEYYDNAVIVAWCPLSGIEPYKE